MTNYKYITLPISFLESHNISQKAFMQDSIESQKFLEHIFSNLPPYIELKNTFLINKTFILALGNKRNITFNNNFDFKNFCEFINTTNFINNISIDTEKREISIIDDISPIFYNLLYEFLI